MRKHFLLLLAAAAMYACNDSETITSGGEGEGEDFDNYAAVIEYLPAPGQFINENMECQTMAEAVAWAQEKLDSETSLVSLGAFGGYITVKLAKTITNNPNGYDFGIKGNPNLTSSEPGIVWVCEDLNGNGKVDENEPWYELQGSDTPKRDYWVKYFRPAEPADIPWVDSEGQEGVVKHMGSFHRQMHYPNWVEEDSYTLEGSILESKTVQEGAQWVNKPFDWGYVDNLGSDAKKSESGTHLYNRFDISDAVKPNGQSAGISKIDFIKVQSAVQQNSGWIGEVSTEVNSFIFFD